LPFVSEEKVMPQITIHIHPKLAERLLAEGIEGARAIGALSQQAARVVQDHGRRIAYAPVILPSGEGCSMSARGGARGVVVEIDPPGRAIPSRGVVKDDYQTTPRERQRIEEARRLKRNRK
jgi:hypothetical protein